jgi:hypothetical protein
LETPTHHADSGEYQTGKADDRSRIDRERFEGVHQRSRAGKIHAALGVSGLGEEKDKQARRDSPQCALHFGFEVSAAPTASETGINQHFQSVSPCKAGLRLS